MKTTCSTCENITSDEKLAPNTDSADRWCITCHQQDGCTICLKGRPKNSITEAELLFRTMNDFVQDMSQDIFQQLCEQLKNQLESKMSMTSSNRTIEMNIAGETYETTFQCQIRCKENDANKNKITQDKNAQKSKRKNRFLRKIKRE